MNKTVYSSCPLDCFDLCRFKLDVENNRVVKIQGDPDHPLTRGIICQKGKTLNRRFEHPDRIRHPLVRSRLLGKTGPGFEKASYDQVLDLIARQLTRIREAYGPTAVIDYLGCGYGGLKGRIQALFFNMFGGATRPFGSLCWGAGIAAQRYDFGSYRAHSPEDVLNSRLILVWGKNPKYTSFHLYSLLKQAEKNGSRVVVIDPVLTPTARSFKEYIRIRPATDAALALAMAKVIIDSGLENKEFIGQHVIGFSRFKASLKKFTPDYAETVTGIPASVIRQLARDYASSSTASIHLGLGMQRYENGGNTVRAIDALAAAAGRIGRKGGGVNYAAKSAAPYLDSVEKQSEAHIREERLFSITRFADFLHQAPDPPVKAAFIAGTNPLNQGPDIAAAVQEYSKIEFKVVFDLFMTDTARFADIVLPAVSVFEQDDIFATSMYSPVVNYSRKAVEPPEGILSEFDFYLELARRMGLGSPGFEDSDDYLVQSAAPLIEKLGIDFETFKNGYPFIREDDIAWSDGRFETPSGKMEIYSRSAEADGLSPLPVFIEPGAGTKSHPLRLLTCHARESMHSQGFLLTDTGPAAHVHPRTAERFKLTGESRVCLKSRAGMLDVHLVMDDGVPEEVVFMYQGFRHENGAVNFLTADRVSDMGDQAAFYETFCILEKSVG